MAEPEPEKVRAIRSLVAHHLGLELDAVEAKERRVPGSDKIFEDDWWDVTAAGRKAIGSRPTPSRSGRLI